MKKSKTWITIGIAFFVGAMTKILWNSIGGARSLPYLAQIVIVVLIPITLFAICRKERKKMNDFQNKLYRLFVIYFAIIFGIICIVIVLNNSFPAIWVKYKSVFEIITPAFFLLFAIYMAIFTLCNI